MHAGERISHGKQIVLNPDDPHLCQIWYALLPTGLIQSLKVTPGFSLVTECTFQIFKIT